MARDQEVFLRGQVDVVRIQGLVELAINPRGTDVVLSPERAREVALALLRAATAVTEMRERSSP
jgi:hypothetical protein